MKVEYYSKKGRQKMKVLESQVKLVTTSKDGKSTEEVYTVAQLIDRYVSFRRSLQVIADFSTKLAVELYRVDPKNEFIAKHGEEFQAFVKRAEDQFSTEDSIKRVQEALLAQSGGENGCAIPFQNPAV
jgi:hypothetical protein